MATKTKSSKKKLTKDEFKRILNTPRREKLTKNQAGRLKILDFIDIYADDDHKENIILLDGLDKAFLGLSYRDGQHGTQVAVYGIFSCIHTLQLDNKWSWDEAEEYFYFNTRYAYVGEYTPMFIEEMVR
jgi:hypothetical protein